MMMLKKKRSSKCSCPITTTTTAADIRNFSPSPSPCSSSSACSPSTSSSSSSCVVDDLVDQPPNNTHPIQVQQQLPTTLFSISNKSPTTTTTVKTRRKRTASSVVRDNPPTTTEEEEQPKKKRRRGKNSKTAAVATEAKVSLSSIDNGNVNIKNSHINTNGNGNGNGNSNRRSSIYRGVTRHRWTGRFEAHLWDKGSWNTIQNKKGKQVYLGAYDCEEDAARTYDLAALKYWGPDTTLNFTVENYTKECEEMQSVSREEYLASLRRRSSGFSRGVSKYRGVARHHHNGRWEARIGRVFGNKYLYLGTFSSQEEAAMAYDLAAIEYRGPNAVTNFDISNYIGKAKNLTTLKEEEDDEEDNNNDPPSQPQPRQNPLCSTETATKQVQLVLQQQLQEERKQEQPQTTTAAAPLESSPSEESSHLQQQQPMITTLDDQCLQSMIMDRDHHLNNHDDHCDPGDDPWSFCLDHDTGGCYNTLVLNDVPQAMNFNVDDGNLLDLLDQVGFEDNIDFIFEEVSNNNNNSPLLPSSSVKEGEEEATAYVAALLEEEEEDVNKKQQHIDHQDDNNSTSSSPISTVSSTSYSHLC